jgi:hypothetical protein
MNIFTVTKSVKAELAESLLFAEAPPDFARDLSSAKVLPFGKYYNPTQMAFRIPYSRYGSLPTSRNLVIYSQRGNVLFPAWEYFVPKVGMKRCTSDQCQDSLFA